MAGEITIRQLETIEELTRMQQVEQTVWQMSPIPVHQTFTALQHGGVILGAFDGPKMVGFLYSFAGFGKNATYLCSHMLGILPDYRKSGLGTHMKLKQADVARELGYSMITWTFDPLESQNAYLNLHKLGAVGAAYKENYYGSMDDQLNQGLPTDRFQVEWDVHAKQLEPSSTFDQDKVLLDTNEAGKPCLHLSRFHSHTNNWFVAIPWGFQEIKKHDIELTREWRSKTGEAFRLLFAKGFTAVDLVNDPTRKTSYYKFSNEDY
ncbi:GNAT family N-acetyltransferase [Virgibacillus kekensis]|uniref:GNAT family N-acetyltransferase n=1 Tax=Virgibacillus kekensis TaxID=202261 RepID=A0ABV9DJI6_9BACI